MCNVIAGAGADGLADFDEVRETDGWSTWSSPPRAPPSAMMA